MLEGSPLIVLPSNAIKSDIQAERIIKKFEINTKKRMKLEDNVRKTLNGIIIEMAATPATTISKIKGFIYMVNSIIVVMAVVAGILIYTIIGSMNSAILEYNQNFPR